MCCFFFDFLPDGEVFVGFGGVFLFEGGGGGGGGGGTWNCYGGIK